MAENQELKGIVSMFADERAAAWMEEHLPELGQYVSGQRLLYQSLVISFVVGLAAHVGGYVLLSSAPSGLLGLLADLLHALGWSLWTGAVVAVFIQIVPEAKRRQIKQAVDAYEALRREKAQAVGNRDTAVLERPDGRRAERKQGQARPRNRARKGG
jgi:ABC-type molybdate transport system permease subunit